MIYDADGMPLGYLWTQRVGGARRLGDAGPILPDDIPNPHLARMVRWICDSARKLDNELLLGVHGTPPSADEAATQFLQDLMEIIDSALQKHRAPELSPARSPRLVDELSPGAGARRG